MSSYINSPRTITYEGPGNRHMVIVPAVDWYAITWDRLSWRYSPEHADRIMEGRDPATQADIARWNSLGRRSAA